MFKYLIYLIALYFCNIYVVCNGAGRLLHNIDWTTKIELENGFEAKWLTTDNEWITIEMKAPTTGWLALGFSHNGAMNGADMVMGWIDSNGTPHIKDLHGVGNELPIEDDSQDVELLGGEATDGFTLIRFRRRWNTCDQHDFVIGEETVKLMWAYGAEDPTKNKFNPRYHGRHERGIKNVNLKLPARHTKFPEETGDTSIKHFDMTMDEQIVPGHLETEYFCKMMQYPTFEQKSQIVGYRPIIQKGNSPYVHHIVIYECTVPEGNSTEIFDKHLGRVEPCFAPSMPSEWIGYCWTQTLVWTIGGEGDMFPKHTGMPIGEKHGGSTYIFMEMHYDNPGLIPFTDNSGLRIYYTETAREEDLSTFFVGKRFSTFHFIPPAAVGYQAFGGCTSECTQNSIPKEGITATHALLHAHTATRKIVLRHVRNGVELKPIAMDTNYDINYQQARIIDPPLLILPGDELYTYCDYDTMDRDIPVWGGIETNATEMCHTFITYYPRMDLSACQYQTEYNDFLNVIGIEKLSGDVLPIVSTPYKPSGKYEPEDEVLVLLSKNLSTNLFTQLTIHDKMHHGKNFWNYLLGLKWRDHGSQLANTINRKLEKTRNYVYCSGRAHIRFPLKENIVHPPVYKRYVDPSEHVCAYRASGLNLTPNNIYTMTTIITILLGIRIFN